MLEKIRYSEFTLNTVSMEIDVSKTYSLVKISCPEVKNILSRKRLCNLLSDDLGRPVKWIQGPPGSGKTVLVADYICSNKAHHIWYQLDETDAYPSSFFDGFRFAIKKNVDREKITLPIFTEDQIFNLSLFSRKFFQKIYSVISPPFTFIFDNYQGLPPESDLHEIMRIGIEEAPPGVSIIFIGRNQIPLSFRRLQANSFIDVIGWNDLTLTKDEFNEISVIRGYTKVFSKKILREVYEQTLGWVAGVVLLLDDLKLKRTPTENLSKISFDEIYFYFTAEIFRHIKEKQRDFLLKSSFLVHPTAAMVVELTGNFEADAILTQFHNNHWFIDKDSQQEPEFQFHPLFRKFLINQARLTYSEIELQDIKGKTADILLNAGHLDFAIKLILETSDWQWFKELAVENARQLIAQGKNSTLINWINQLPEDVIYGNSWLLYWLGRSEMAFDPQKSQDCFEIAFSHFRKTKDRTGLFQAWSGIITANIYKFESGDSFEKWISVGYDLMSEFPAFPSVDIETDMLISLLSGLILIGTAHDEIDKVSKRVLELSNRVNDDWNREKGILLLSLYYTSNGYIHRSETFLSSIRDIGKSENEPLINRVFNRHLELLNLFYSAKNQKCIELALKQSKDSSVSHLHFWKVSLIGHAAAAALSEENFDEARLLIKKMKSKLVTGQNINTFYYQLLSAWSLLTNDLHFALHLVQNALKLAIGLGFKALIHTALVALAQVYHELDQASAAKEALQKAYQIANDTRNPLALCQCEITDAYFSIRQKNDEQAAKLLKKAMGTARKQDAVNFLFWRHTIMSRLCAKALELKIEEEYVKNIIKKRSLTIDATSHNVENWPWKIKIFTMGRFDIIVDNIPLAFTGKVQKTPLAILKILISFGCINVRQDRISDILWPESAGDAGYRAFITTVQRLRRLLGYKEAIILNEGKLSLNPNYCWVDVWAVESHFKQLGNCWKQIDNEKNIGQIVSLTESLYEKYREPFLPGDEELFWSFTMRDKIKTGVLKNLIYLRDIWEKQENWKKVLEICLKGLDIDDTSEELLQKQLFCYKQLGCRAEAINAFNRFQNILLTRLGIDPSQKTKAIMDSILNSSKSDSSN